MDFLDNDNEFRPQMRRNTATDLSNSLQVISGIKPLSKPLQGTSPQQTTKYDTSQLSQYIGDFYRQDGPVEIRGMQQHQSANRAKFEQSHADLQKLLKQANKLLQITDAIQAHLKEIWEGQRGISDSLMK